MIYELFKDHNYLKIFYSKDTPVPVFKINNELRIIFPKIIENRLYNKYASYVYYIDTNKDKILIQTQKTSNKIQKVKLRKNNNITELFISKKIQKFFKIRRGSYLEYEIKNNKIFLKKSKYKPEKDENKEKYTDLKKIEVKKPEKETQLINYEDKPKIYSRVYQEKNNHILFIPIELFNSLNMHKEEKLVWILKKNAETLLTFLILDRKNYRKLRVGKIIDESTIQKTNRGNFIIIPKIIITEFNINKNTKCFWKLHNHQKNKKYIELIFENN